MTNNIPANHVKNTFDANHIFKVHANHIYITVTATILKKHFSSSVYWVEKPDLLNNPPYDIY